MEALKIIGGQPLVGKIQASGSKNAALPILAATLLVKGTSKIYGVPRLRDVATMLKILSALGAEINWEDDCLAIDTSKVNSFTAPYELVKQMRASICLLGPLLVRFGRVRISLPGGCVIGDRPIDLHLRGLEKLGGKFRLEEGYVEGTVENLRGAPVFLGGNFGSSVLATANLLMTTVLTPGETLIEFAACEPEVVDLSSFLVQMGAKISGVGSHLIRVVGTDHLQPAEHRVIPDRIEVGTFLLAGAITGGEVEVTDCNPDHLFALLTKLEEAGAIIAQGNDWVRVGTNGRLRGADIVTLPYPGFPTDLQAQFMALMSLAEGTSVITEKVFPERFIHAAELKRLGADIVVKNGSAVIRGRERLTGTEVMASDLRASAALVLAGLAAVGETVVSRIYHLDRGYEAMEQKLKNLNARVVRIQA